MGADNTLDYLSVPVGCKLFSALPHLGWKSAPSVGLGVMAAPALAIAWATCLPVHADGGAEACLEGFLVKGFHGA